MALWVNPASSLLQLETRPTGRSCGCFLPRNWNSWQSVKEFFVSIHLIPASHVLDMYECLGFGGEEDDVLLNHCLLLARYYIHSCKLKNVSPCIGEYVQRLKFNFEIEKQVSMATGSENKFQERWCNTLQAL